MSAAMTPTAAPALAATNVELTLQQATRDLGLEGGVDVSLMGKAATVAQLGQRCLVHLVDGFWRRWTMPIPTILRAALASRLLGRLLGTL